MGVATSRLWFILYKVIPNHSWNFILIILLRGKLGRRRNYLNNSIKKKTVDTSKAFFIIKYPGEFSILIKSEYYYLAFLLKY